MSRTRTTYLDWPVLCGEYVRCPAGHTSVRASTELADGRRQVRYRCGECGAEEVVSANTVPTPTP